MVSTTMLFSPRCSTDQRPPHSPGLPASGLLACFLFAPDSVPPPHPLSIHAGYCGEQLGQHPSRHTCAYNIFLHSLQRGGFSSRGTPVIASPVCIRGAGDGRQCPLTAVVSDGQWDLALPGGCFAPPWLPSTVASAWRESSQPSSVENQRHIIGSMCDDCIPHALIGVMSF